MPKTNAEYCRDYRNKQRVNRTIKTAKSSVERVREFRARKKALLNVKNDSSITHNDDFSVQKCDHNVKDTFGNEMEVNEQTDSQTNETVDKTNITETCNDNVRHRRVDELDKFKRRLIRAIARLLHVENKPEADIWDDLKIETGCDCELLWSRMRALTIKKLVRLFTADDKIENITKIAQLSVTDWLLYDLVLVHEKVDVIGQELVNKEEPPFLRDLFDLVEEFNIENAAGEALTKKWFDATAKYNNTGKRQCSPMLLQKRWYQLKERSRSNFYNFWFQYRGDPRKLEKANEFKPSDLQLDIVKRYKDIVTMPFLSWEVLIKEGRVALPEDFERLRLNRNKISVSENEPDLQLIEEQVETIDLVETNDATELMNKETGNEDGCNDLNIDIVKVESLAEHDDEVSVLESVHIPFEKYESSVIHNSDREIETTMRTDDNDLEIIESDSEQNMPKIASVTSTAHLKSAEDLKNKESTQKKYETKGESVKSVNIILEQIVRNVVENKITIPYHDNHNHDEKVAATKEKILNSDKDIKELNSNAIINIESKEDDKIDEPKTAGKIDEKSDLDLGFDDFSNNLNFIDDGIEFIDDGIEYMDEDCVQECNMKPGTKSEAMEATNEDEPKIDLKLLLTPVVFTKKLDDMDVFRFIDYNSVKDVRVLQNAARESKPKVRKSIIMKEIIQKCNNGGSKNEEPVSVDVLPDDDIIISSWLFRKPKVNNYNPIQLCKNPDFNTRLKRLSAAFYTSQRNRLQLKQCKSLTVDLHKTFESKLINNTLYLKKSKKDGDTEGIVNEMTSTSCKTEIPEDIEPSDDSEIADQRIPVEQTSEIHTERNKVINLPDIEQIRRVNQGLLVAEVSPIQVNPMNQKNIKPLNNLLSTDIEPVSEQIDSAAVHEEVIETPEIVSRGSLQTDIEIAISKDDNSKVTDRGKVDIELKGKSLSSKYAIKDSAKNYRMFKKSLLKQSGPRTRTKPVPKKHMQLSWLPKPQATKIDPIDCLLAADTVERILSLCKNDYVPPNLKVLRTKRKKKTDVTGKITSENPKKAVSKKIVNHEKKNNKDAQKPKKGKCRTNITVQTTNIKNVCCWARRKIENLYKLNTGKHFCLYNQCVCCCKADLEAKIRELEQERKEKELIILSDDESITAAKKQTISKVTIGTNTDYDKDFEDQFAANLHKFKDNVSQFLTPIISLPLGDLPQTFSNESGCQTLTPNRIENTPPYATVDDTIPEDTNTHKNKPSVPLCLGKNKILLCSFQTTSTENSSQKLIKINKSSQSEQILPEGCHLVLLPNRELALSINPGVELDSNQLSKLPSVLASVQKQINTLAPEKIIESNNITIDEETVIDLSDDENSSIKNDINKNVNIDDSITTELQKDCNNANVLSEVGVIANEEKEISSKKILSIPKELGKTTESATTSCSTLTDADSKIVESKDKVTQKDNCSGEVIDNVANSTEDTSVNKKTILSDLMEMSGISTDDINVPNSDLDPNVSNIATCATNNEEVSTFQLEQQVLSQSDSSRSDLQCKYSDLVRKIGINPIINNLVVRAALLRCPELNIVSSFPELKFAYENGAQFFKMDVVNGIILPINVCIKKTYGEIKMQHKKSTPKKPKTVIDLTEENEIDTRSSNLRPILPKMTTQQTNELCDDTIENMQTNKNIKPIKMFKAIHPSILRYSGRSLLVRPLNDSTMTERKIVRITKNRRKQRLCTKNIDLDSDNILVTQTEPFNIDSGAESDEEPLAKKAKRLKVHSDIDTNNINIDPSLDVDSDMNGKDSVAADINYKLQPPLEPIVFEDNAHSSDDDCILGV